MTEAINHPEYYGGDDVYEVIKVLEAWDLELAKGFCWGNMIKYSARAGKKSDNEVQDRLKAEWYANRLATITATLEGRRQSEDERMERIKAGTEPGFTLATPGPSKLRDDGQPFPKVGSHWIWRNPNNVNGARCRVRVTGLQSDYVHTTTLAIEGRADPAPGDIKSSYTSKQFFEECEPWDAAAIDPWVAEARVNIWPTPGTEWMWEKDKPIVRCRVQVVAINKAPGNEWVKAKTITRDRVQGGSVHGMVLVSLDRWHKAVTSIPYCPYFWEKEV